MNDYYLEMLILIIALAHCLYVGYFLFVKDSRPWRSKKYFFLTNFILLILLILQATKYFYIVDSFDRIFDGLRLSFIFGLVSFVFTFYMKPLLNDRSERSRENFLLKLPFLGLLIPISLDSYFSMKPVIICADFLVALSIALVLRKKPQINTNKKNFFILSISLLFKAAFFYFDIITGELLFILLIQIILKKIHESITKT